MYQTCFQNILTWTSNNAAVTLFQVAFSELEKGVCKRRLILLKARLLDIFDWLFIEKFFCVSLMSRSFLCN